MSLVVVPFVLFTTGPSEWVRERAVIEYLGPWDPSTLGPSSPVDWFIKYSSFLVFPWLGKLHSPLPPSRVYRRSVEICFFIIIFPRFFFRCCLVQSSRAIHMDEAAASSRILESFECADLGTWAWDYARAFWLVGSQTYCVGELCSWFELLYWQANYQCLEELILVLFFPFLVVTWWAPIGGRTLLHRAKIKGTKRKNVLRGSKPKVKNPDRQGTNANTIVMWFTNSILKKRTTMKNNVSLPLNPHWNRSILVCKRVNRNTANTASGCDDELFHALTKECSPLCFAYMKYWILVFLLLFMVIGKVCPLWLSLTFSCFDLFGGRDAIIYHVPITITLLFGSSFSCHVSTFSSTWNLNISPQDWSSQLTENIQFLTNLRASFFKFQSKKCSFFQ